jgi:hypothetical protein
LVFVGKLDLLFLALDVKLNLIGIIGNGLRLRSWGVRESGGPF